MKGLIHGPASLSLSLSLRELPAAPVADDSSPSMASRRLIPIFTVLILLLVFSTHKSESNEEEEEFSEELALKPLPDRKVLSHFYFNTKAPPTPTHGHHHRLFPKAIYQLVHQFRIREMELSFTQGRWNYERWGSYDPISSNNAKPPGVELWAVFNVPENEIDATWKNLTQALSGLFCASINFLESSTAYSSPKWGFSQYSENIRYGSLPREAVCTENLTPWLKLLPCRDKSGLSTLFDRPSIYKGFYHSQRLRLTSTEFDDTILNTGIVLEQTLTLVLEPHLIENRMEYSGVSKLQPSWSLSTLFGRKVYGKCVIAKSSNVYLLLEEALVSEMENADNENTREYYLSHSEFEISVSPNRVIKEFDKLNKGSILYEFLVENYNNFKPFDLKFTWRLPIVWSCPQAPLHASRFLMGSGNERGAIAISLKPTRERKVCKTSEINADICSLQVHIFQVVPWYVKVYYHTLQIFVDGKSLSVSNLITKMRVSPSKDKVSPGVMEMVLQLPSDVKSAVLIIEFDKGFLHIDQYPPDANQGFDIPSAIVSFPDFQTKLNFLEETASVKSPLLSKLQEKSPVLSYTEVLLVPLTTPDFSMPYNVITITCTVCALYFGSLLNSLRRRIGEEERRLKDKAAEKNAKIPVLFAKLCAKLRGRPFESQQASSTSTSFINSKLIFKIVLIAGLAAGWQYYFS